MWRSWGKLSCSAKDLLEALKEVDKFKESHKKELVVVHAGKLQLGDDLLKSTKGKKKSKETEGVLLKAFECMTEYIEIKGYEVAEVLKFNDSR